jgi:hypothetical protein
LWTFGSARHASDDGWSLAKGVWSAGTGFVTLRVDDAQATLISPPDQVLRSDSLQSLYIGLRESDSLEAVEVHARIDPAAPWQEIVPATPAGSLVRAAPGLAVPLAWPADWRSRAVIAESLRIVLKFRPGTEQVRIDRIALYPRANAVTEARMRR